MKLEPGAARGAMRPPPVVDDYHRFRCLDGALTSADVAKAAKVSRKLAIRAIKEFCATSEDGRSEGDGATVTFGHGKVPDPATQTRAQMATAVAVRLELGRYGLKRRIAERAAVRPPDKPRGNRMSSTQHPWTVEKHGRAVKSEDGGGVIATLTCSRCPSAATIRFRQLADSREMDRKFTQQGWAVDPSKCPEHNRRNHQPRKDTTMATAAPPTFAAPTPAAIAAQGKMVALLQTHFDVENGTYGSGYSDAKVAEECHLSVELVAGVRKQAFGELKVPAEVARLTADIEALESLIEEATVPLKVELQSLRRRVSECCKKFGG